MRTAAHRHVLVFTLFLAFVVGAESLRSEDVVGGLASLVKALIPESHLQRLTPDLHAASADIGSLNPSDSSLGSTLKSTLEWAESVAASSWNTALSDPIAKEYPYFGVIPKYVGAARDGVPLTLPESRCWKSATATIEKSDSAYTLKVIVSGNKGGILPFACIDYYFVATVASWHLASFGTPVPGTKSYKFELGKLTDAELWDIQTKGVRMFRFRDDLHTLTAELAKTVELLTPLIGKCCKAPSTSASKNNVDFLQKYANVTMKPRTTKVVTVNETDIHSGDFLGIIRLDGLDPMLAWGMGSTTGHTAIAMRDEAGVLHVLESTTNGSYWPTNGIQSTPWARWVPQAITAGHQVVHAPLSEEARKSFDVTKAREFFATQKDLNYGFGTLLVGWIDTVSQNFPCLPPYDGAEDQSYCLTWELIEVLFPLLSKEVAVVSEVYLEAWNHRIGVKATGPQCAGCLPPADVLMKANQSGIVANTLFSIVESDDWQYSQQ